ncbi:hypothetical protein ACP70R_007963 [Stipagrostis hirtigluma subsp. patula]
MAASLGRMIQVNVQQSVRWRHMPARSGSPVVSYQSEPIYSTAHAY